mmetsp:Transcript_3719/g.4151  ORF Transcript_3719/g.4151 Transcript_3719/m.4151 type:complete len:392 (+) Transcript_3719:109-1284(+)
MKTHCHFYEDLTANLILVHTALIGIWALSTEFLERVGGTSGSHVGSNDLGQVDNTLAVAPLVVIPSNHLHHIISHDHGQGAVHCGRNISHTEVAGHQGVHGDIKDSLHWALARLNESSVNLLDSDSLLLHVHNKVDDGNVRGGDTEGNTVQLALELRENKSHGLGSSGGGGNNVEGSGTGTAKIAVGGIEKPLVTGVGVGGGHGSLDDSELVVKNLGERGQAVGGARSVGVDVGGGIEVGVVHTDNVGWDIRALGRGSDHNLLGTSQDVLASTRAVDEDTGTLDDDVNVHLAPRKLGGIASRHNLDDLAIDREGLVINHLDIGVECSEHRVVLEQVSGLLAALVVNDNDLEVAVLTSVPAPEEVTSDTAETVNSHASLALSNILGTDGSNL